MSFLFGERANARRSFLRLPLEIAALVVFAALALVSTPGRADTATASSTWPPGQVKSTATNINGPSNGQQTSFTGYTGGTYNYVTYPFTVGTSGTYTATSSTTNVVNTTWILKGTYTPGQPPPVPLSNYVVAVLSGSNPNTGTFTGTTLVSGQQYTMLVQFNTGSVSGDVSNVSISGPGCVIIGSNTCGPVLAPTLSEYGIFAFAALLIAFAIPRLRKIRSH